MRPGTSPIGYLDPNNYLGYKLALQQENDRLCQWFINDVVNPMLAGADPAYHPKMGALIDQRLKFGIYRGRRAADYDLLVYKNSRIYVPRQGQFALIQAAHAAAHQGLGSTRSLLKSPSTGLP